MKRLLLIVSLILLPILSFATPPAWNGAAITHWNGTACSAWNGVSGSNSTRYCTSSTSDGVTTFIICEDFEGSSYCYGSSGDQNCWNNFPDYWGSPDWNYSSSAIEGTYSLYLTSGERILYTLGTTTSPLYFYAKITLGGTLAGNDSILYITNESGDTLLNINSYTDSKLRAICGTGAATGTFTAGAGTYNLWVDYTAVSGGSDGVLHVYISSTTTKGSADITVTNCSVTGSPKNLYLQSVADGPDTTWDRIRLKSSDMTTVP